MPFFEHPEAETPSPNTVIWRYVNVLQFLTMLEQRSLYFALLRELDDTWEAALSKRLEATLRQGGPDRLAAYKTFLQITAVNCWHANRTESVAMWRLYTSEGHGVAIQSTVGRLMGCFNANAKAVQIGRVFYQDHDSAFNETYPDSPRNMFKAAFQKRECYRHESEVRALISYVDRFPADLAPGTRIPYPAQGARIEVDLGVLIERVVLSAKFPLWGRGIMESSIKRAGLSLPLEESAMLLKP